ncbi:MAG: hypothetical protein KatS3mg105_2783 [Gemmatales bacterium]|nr:MAG: hypothetical protein KatS3mg105_2783 [Gemmatales bacterium]
MKSIRLSMTGYFLLLAIIAVAVIGSLVYRTSADALEQEAVSTKQMLVTSYQTQSEEVRNKWDEHILQRAKTIASLAQLQRKKPALNHHYVVGMVGAALQPHGQLLFPLWAAEGRDGVLWHRLRWMSYVEIKIAEGLVANQGGEEFFQVYGQRGTPLLRSDSLPAGKFTLAPDVRDRLQLFDWVFDDLTLVLKESDVAPVKLRRITLKFPVSRFRFQYFWHGWPSTRRSKRSSWSPWPPRSDSEKRYHPPPFPKDGFDHNSPAIFVQYAVRTDGRDAELAGMQAQFERDLTRLSEKSSATMNRLRNKLIWIAVLTFATASVGAFVLVSRGLLPLRRLSKAVSQVSPKDFRLNLDHSQLPDELQPIASRLAATLEQLRRAFEREKQAAADISHELRTPVAAMLATLEVALRKPRSREEYQEALTQCQQICLQMSQLVEKLLALARLDTGTDHAHIEDADVSALVKQCAEMVRPIADSHNIELHTGVPEGIRFPVDVAKLREVVNNLLHNAVQYNRPGGSVDLILQRQNGTLQLEVRDTGIGIDEKDREHVFDRFYRADGSRQGDGMHAGLGLSITKCYVEMLGGSIEVASTKGKGSTFRVILSQQPPSPEAN